MAGWLNSKLKAAEQFLQQIDQQAAESLKRSDNGMPLPLTLTEDNPPGPSERDYAKSAGLTTSEQGYLISKMPAPKSLSNIGKISGAHNDQATLNNMSLNGKNTGTRKPASQDPANHAPGKMSKDDWTELLASPALIGNSSISRASSVGSSDLGVSSIVRGVPMKSHFYSTKGQNDSAILAPTMVVRAAKQQAGLSTVVPASHQVQPAEKLLLNCAAVNKSFHGEAVGRYLNLDENSDQDGNSEFQDLRLEDAESSTEEGQSSRSHKKHMKLASGDENYSGRMEPRVDAINKTPISEKEDKMKSLKEISDSNLVFLERQQSAVETLKLREFTGINEEMDAMNIAAHNHLLKTSLDHVSVSTKQQAAGSTVEKAHELGKIASASEADNLVQPTVLEAPVPESNEGLPKDKITRNKIDDAAKDTLISDTSILTNGLGNEPDGSRREQNAISVAEKEGVSDTETEVDSDTDSEYEENLRRLTAEKRRLVERKTAELAAVEAAKAALREREELVKRLEKEKDSLEHALEEREEKQAKEAEDLRTSMTEVMDAVEMEKQRHTMTRKEALAKEAKLEAENAQLAKALAAAQRNLDKELSHLIQVRSKVDAQKVSKADLERKIAKLYSWISHPQTPPQVEEALKVESDYGSVAEEKTEILSKIDYCKTQVKSLEEKLANAKNVQQTPTAVELELEHRLNQLTEHLIQKQAQVEELSTEKVTLVFRLEALSNFFRDKKSALGSPSTNDNKGDIYDWSGIDDDMEYGRSKLYSSKYKSSTDVYNGLHGNRHAKALINPHFLEGFYRRIYSIFLGGANILWMHKLARALAGFYLLALHCWVFFILFMNSNRNRDSSSIADASSVLSVADSVNALNATSKS